MLGAVPEIKDIAEITEIEFRRLPSPAVRAMQRAMKRVEKARGTPATRIT